MRRSDSNSSGWSRCPISTVLLYQLHCFSWPDEYLIGICRFICMLYNFSLCNGSTSREAAVPTLALTRTPSSAEGSLRCCSKEQRAGLIQGVAKAFPQETFSLCPPPFSNSPMQRKEFGLQHTGFIGKNAAIKLRNSADGIKSLQAQLQFSIIKADREPKLLVLHMCKYSRMLSALQRLQ